MIKKVSKMIIKIIMISLIFQTIYMPISRAETSWNEIFDAGRNFLVEGQREIEKEGSIVNQNELQHANSDIFNILLSLGVVIAVIIGAILGIQLMWGSIEQQVKAKEMLMAYAIGCIVVFGAFGIWKICIQIFSQL